MAAHSNNPNKLAFSSQCVPGSLAEQQEAERLEEFQRSKALRLAEEERDRPQAVAKRHEEYLAASEANKERMSKKRAGYATYAPPGNTSNS